MTNYVLISVDSETQRTFSQYASAAKPLVASANDHTRYMLLDSNTKKTPENLNTRREKDDLLLEIDGEMVARIEGFHDGINDSRFVVIDAPGIWTVLVSSEAMIGETQSVSEPMIWAKGYSATAVDENGAAITVHGTTSDEANATYTLGEINVTAFTDAVDNGDTAQTIPLAITSSVTTDDLAAPQVSQRGFTNVTDPGFVVIWESSGQDRGDNDIYLQCFSAAGTALGEVSWEYHHKPLPIQSGRHHAG